MVQTLRMDAKTNRHIGDCFRRFDVDGDGVVTRQELASVMRKLDPQVWTNDRIDRLLATVDSNGDGRIQYDEFVHWVMGRRAARRVAKELVDDFGIAGTTSSGGATSSTGTRRRGGAAARLGRAVAGARASAAISQGSAGASASQPRPKPIARLDPRAAVAAMDGNMEVRIAEAFFHFDTNRDGIISKSELANVLQSLDPDTWKDEKISLLLEFADVNRDNRIQYNEFVAWVLGKSAARELAAALTASSAPSTFYNRAEERRGQTAASVGLTEEECMERINEAFRRFDADGDGVISRSELAGVLRRLEPSVWDTQRLDKLLENIDTNGDGRIQYDEFVSWVWAHEDALDRRRCLDLMANAAAGAAVLDQRAKSSSASSGPITVSIVKMNGKTLKSVVLDLSDTVRTLRGIASEALGGQSCRLAADATFLGSGLTLAQAGLYDGAAVTAVATSGILQMAGSAGGGGAVVKADGSVVTWGPSSVGGDASAVAEELRADVDTVVATSAAFAALKDSGTVVAWGHPDSGGMIPKDIEPMLAAGVKQLVATSDTFAALKVDGSVVCWGSAWSGAVDDLLSGGGGAVKLFANDVAFAALRADGTVVSWGAPCCGGVDGCVLEASGSGRKPSSVAPRAIRLRKAVMEVFATSAAFAALQVDGSVVSWGDSQRGGDASAVAEQLQSGVRQVFSNDYAFAALKADGSVVTWGHSSGGGNSTDVARHLLGGIQTLSSTRAAFAALSGDGAVVSWGWGPSGGDMGAVAEQLAEVEVRAVHGTGSAFAAVTSDGGVVTWGEASDGGDPGNASGRIREGTQKLFSTDRAFAALTADWSIVTWGAKEWGGDPGIVAEQLREGVVDVFATRHAFAAVKVDNSIAVWGAGVSPSAVARLQPFYSPVAAG